MVTTHAVHAPALSLPEAAMLSALPKKKGDASVDASPGGSPGKDLRGVDVAVGVKDDAHADLRPGGGQNIVPVAL